MKTKWKVSQTFEAFGDSIPEFAMTEDEAFEFAARQAKELAEAFYKRVGDEAVIPYCRPRYTLGPEADFFNTLTDESNATEDEDGRFPWNDLVTGICLSAIQIEEVKETESEQ